MLLFTWLRRPDSNRRPLGYEPNEKRIGFSIIPISCGGLTRTDDLWVMSPTSYQLLHSAMFIS